MIDSYHASSDSAFDPKVTEYPRDQIYNNAAREKTARAEEFSAIKRVVSKDNIVIADGLNYIKGYRYQLWCEAKAAGTRCCVVHVAAQEDECKKWNEERLFAWEREAEIEHGQISADRDATKIGKDVVGSLMPESHTAVYGDRVVEPVSRSCSSSIDAFDDGEEQSERPRPDDTMTLKSLYISDRPETDTKTPPHTHNGTNPQTDHLEIIPSRPVPPPTSAHPYAPSTLTSLTMRYEPPSPFSRWDTPLFTIPTSDIHPPYADIWNAIFPAPTKAMSKKALSQLPRQDIRDGGSAQQTIRESKAEQVKQHAATLLPRATSASALQILESTTLDVVRTLLTAAREQFSADGEGGTVHLSVSMPKTSLQPGPQQRADMEPQSLQAEIRVPSGTVLSQPQLQRLRRKYTQIQRGAIAHGQDYAGMRDGREGIVRGFIGFLGRELGDQDE